jgi:cardiolipin synthase
MQLSHESVKLWLSVGWSLYVVVVGIWILLQRSQPIATLSWLLSMAALPVVGLLVYYYFGPQRMKRQRIKRLRSRKRSRVRNSMQKLRERIPAQQERLRQVARLVGMTSDFPVSTATSMQLLVGARRPLMRLPRP